MAKNTKTETAVTNTTSETAVTKFSVTTVELSKLNDMIRSTLTADGLLLIDGQSLQIPPTTLLDAAKLGLIRVLSKDTAQPLAAKDCDRQAILTAVFERWEKGYVDQAAENKAARQAKAVARLATHSVRGSSKLPFSRAAIEQEMESLADTSLQPAITKLRSLEDGPFEVWFEAKKTESKLLIAALENLTVKAQAEAETQKQQLLESLADIGI